MEKVVRDGKVAVLYSPGFGAGWYSWHYQKELIFHPELVRLVEENKKDEITEEFCCNLLGLDFKKDYVCCLGAEGLKIKWIEEGQPFEITEYDGNESCGEIYLGDFLIA